MTKVIKAVIAGHSLNPHTGLCYSYIISHVEATSWCRDIHANIDSTVLISYLVANSVVLTF